MTRSEQEFRGHRGRRSADLDREPGADVIIDPRFGFGQPVFAGSKVPVEAVADLFYGGGESVDDIADQYGLTTSEVESVLRVLARRAA